MTILRAYPAAVPAPPLDPGAPTAALPGLVSSLRPLKRLSTNLGEEAALLRRFTYKNKNQHKGCGWWRRIVEVDRAVERVTGEVGGLLGEFGMSVGDKEDAGAIGIAAVARGAVRLPRSAALVDKFIMILEGCASILEQLIESRAFLPFSVVVVALVARLHTLSTVLAGELVRLSAVLVRLARSNSILPQLEKDLLSLPKTLRHYIILRPPSAVPPSHPPSALHSPADSPAPLRANDDLGAVISRPLPPLPSKNAPPLSKPPRSTPTPSIALDVPPPTPSDVAATLDARPPKGDRPEKKRPSQDPTLVGEAGAEGKVPKKRKKKVKAKGDEIDDIFG
ncbi:hypothetical protein RQP46_001314 [Phenoliferia psychrophenolica]